MFPSSCHTMDDTVNPCCISANRFCLNECVEWIESLGCHNVHLYFMSQFYRIASEITNKLKQLTPKVNFMVMISGSSGVDTTQYRMMRQQLDGVIYFGATCLCHSKYSSQVPILLLPLQSDQTEMEYISRQCLPLLNKLRPQKILLLADWTNSWVLNDEHCKQLNVGEDTNVHVGQFVTPANLSLGKTSGCRLATSDADQSGAVLHSPYLIPEPLLNYELVLFVGECSNLELIINCRTLLVIDPQRRSSQTLEGAKECRKRIALVEKFKNQQIGLVGIVFYNYAQSVSSVMQQVQVYCKSLQKVPYFLSLNQNDIELRLGNFGQLEGFVLINCCECTMPIALSTAKYLHPVIFWKEFLIACSQPVTYGGIQWNTDCHNNEHQQELEKSHQDGKSQQQQQTNMALVERDLFQRPTGWFGLEMDNTGGADKVTTVGPIQEGLRGIPSAYSNEQELF